MGGKRLPDDGRRTDDGDADTRRDETNTIDDTANETNETDTKRLEKMKGPLNRRTRHGARARFNV